MAEVITKEQERRLLAVADETWRAVIGLMLGAGLRRSEALDLRADQVDLAAARLTVPGTSFVRGRQVVLPAPVAESLAAVYRRRSRAGVVFPSLRGNRWCREWVALTRAAGVPDLQLHDLRAAHTQRTVIPSKPLATGLDDL